MSHLLAPAYIGLLIPVGLTTERAGVSRKTVNTVENGVFVPSVLLALQLARSLGTSVESLFYLASEKRWPAAQGED